MKTMCLFRLTLLSLLLVLAACVQAKQNDDHYQSQHHNFSLSTITNSDEMIWAFDFLPNGDLIFTERSGNLVLVSKGRQVVIEGTPKVWRRGQGGLLDVAVDPDYENNGWIYLSYSQKGGTNNKGKDVGGLVILRGKIFDEQWQDHQVLYQVAKGSHINRGRHFGSRFAFQGDYLFFSYGDEGHQDLAQDLTRPGGKIHRIYKNGAIPQDNPFVKKNGAIASIWTYGNRNPQGMTVSPVTGDIWSSEHGPRGGDELNVINKGLNYGWPKVSHGINYDGSILTKYKAMAGMESPKHYWTPSIAVAGINFYTGEQFPRWRNQLFVASLKLQELHRIKVKGSAVVEDEIVLKGQGRIRDVATAPDGSLYIAINTGGKGGNKIVKLTPTP